MRVVTFSADGAASGSYALAGASDLSVSDDCRTAWGLSNGAIVSFSIAP